MNTHNFIILDRDGVINQDSKDFIKSPDEWIPIPGSIEAIVKLHHHDYKVIVATNQSGIGRKLFTLEDLDKIHQKMIDVITKAGGKIDNIFFCPHLPEDNCLCRKPKPGLFKEIEKYYGIDFKNQTILAVGDSLRDLEAAANAGAKPILVKTGNGDKTLATLPEKFKNIACYANLAVAVDTLINIR